MRVHFLALVLGFALISPVLTAQPALHIQSPNVVVSEASWPVMNDAYLQNPFRQLVLTLPGRGSYVVRTRPFRGAEQLGQFQGNALTFTDETTSVRITSAVPILANADLGPDASIPAYVGRSPYGRNSDFPQAAIGMTLLDVDSLYATQLNAWAERLAPTLSQYNQTSSDYNTRLAQFRAEHAALLGETAAFEQMRAAYVAETQRYEAEHTRVLATYDQLVRGGTTQSRQAYTTDVERLQNHAQRLATMHADLQRALGYLTAEHNRLASASEVLRAEMTAHDVARQALLNEHAQLVTARERLRTQ